jgi:putative chitinase
MIPVNADTLRAIAPKFAGAHAIRQGQIIDAVGPVLAEVLEEYEINTRLRIAHFLGQICHESAGFRTTEEFASGADYEWRKDLGNVYQGDGVRYKGRGLIQLTGRANYREFGGRMGLGLEAHPQHAAEPVISLSIACEYWKQRGINVPCDRDDLLEVTRRINGGTNGLDDRRVRTSLAKTALAQLEGEKFARSAPSDQPVLRRGSQGDNVGYLQTALRNLGFALAIDGDFGPGTEVAVARFQRDKRLVADGIVGPATWRALIQTTQ